MLVVVGTQGSHIMEEKHDVNSGRSVMMTIGSNPKLYVGSDQNVKDKFEEEVEEIVPLPPDGGWGWVVVFASFMCNMILDGIAYTFGVLLTPLVNHFDSDKGTVSWVGSLLCGMYMLSGPIVGGLVNKFGCRPVCMAGAVLSWAAFSLSTLSPSVPVLMITYGCLGGFGLGLIYLPAIVSVGFYFESKRALATGISVCGSGVGTFVFAPLANWLLYSYGWRVSNLVFAAICLLCIIFGALMRPLEEVYIQNNRKDSQIMMELPDGTKVPSTISSSHSFKGLPIIGSVATMAKITEDEEYPEQNEDDENVEKGENKNESLQEAEARKARRERRLSERRFSNTRISRNFSSSYLQPVRVRHDSIMSTTSNKSLKGSASSSKLPRPMSRIDIFYTGSIRNISEEDELGLRSNRQSYVSIGGMKGRRGSQGSQIFFPRNSLVDTTIVEEECENVDNGVLAMLKTMLNPELLKDPKFLLIGISNAFGFLGFYVPFVYLPSMAHSNEGISKDQAAFLLSVIGISNTFGRLVSGWISDFYWVDSLFVVNASLILSSICVFVFPFLTSYTYFVALGILFGLFIAAYIALTSIVLVDICGIENLTSAFGLLTVFRGAASIVGPPLAGAVYEATHSYSVSFYLAGSFLLLAAGFSILADIFRRKEKVKLDLK